MQLIATGWCPQCVINFNVGLFQISGVLHETNSTFCYSSNKSTKSVSTPKIAVVLGGGCKNYKKTEFAAKEGYQGLIILDKRTKYKYHKYISGKRSQVTNNTAVVYLLKKESYLLQELLTKSPNRNVTITGRYQFCLQQYSNKWFQFLVPQRPWLGLGSADRFFAIVTYGTLFLIGLSLNSGSLIQLIQERLMMNVCTKMNLLLIHLALADIVVCLWYGILTLVHFSKLPL